MKAEELRIGNFIGMNLKEFPENWFRVLEPATHSMKVTDNWNRYDMKGREVDFYDADLMEGIPLTPEWLERLGFKKQKNNLDFTKAATEHCVYFLRWSEAYKEVHAVSVCHPVIDSSSTSFAWHLKYVHQLQNLYFALTGQELTLKP